MFNLILLVFLSCLFIFLIIFWFIQVSLGLRKDTIGFVPSLSKKINLELINSIQKYVPNTSSYNFIELGAGLANITQFLASKFTFKKIVAVELDFFTIMGAKFLNLFSKNQVEFVHKNIFDYEVPKKSVIYCYLGNLIMEKLYKTGALKGSVVLSATFSIKDVKYTECIDLPGTFYRKLYVYDFTKEV